jgi:hypothetical protein
MLKNCTVRSGWLAALALAGVAMAQAAAAQPAMNAKDDQKAVQPCQDEIRNKVKAKHADGNVNFESVETKGMDNGMVAVKGKFNLKLGADGNTMNYVCRVDTKEMKVLRAEWGKENSK